MNQEAASGSRSRAARPPSKRGTSTNGFTRSEGMRQRSRSSRDSRSCVDSGSSVAGGAGESAGGGVASGEPGAAWAGAGAAGATAGNGCAGRPLGGRGAGPAYGFAGSGATPASCASADAASTTSTVASAAACAGVKRMDARSVAAVMRWPSDKLGRLDNSAPFAKVRAASGVLCVDGFPLQKPMIGRGLPVGGPFSFWPLNATGYFPVKQESQYPDDAGASSPRTARCRPSTLR
jgi:hypothetical protein